MSRHTCAGQRTACGSLSFYPEVLGLNSEWQALCQTLSPAEAAPDLTLDCKNFYVCIMLLFLWLR